MNKYKNEEEYNKLVNKTKKQQTHRYREQTSGYQWGGGRRKGQDRGRGKKVIMRLYEIICVKLLKTVKQYRISRIFHSMKEKKKG